MSKPIAVKFASPALFLLAFLPGLFPLGSALFAAAEDDDTDKARITGVVVDADEVPVSNAVVRVIDADLEPVRTDEAGRFSVALKQCNVEACLVASDATGARMGMWQTLRNGVLSLANTAEVRIVLRPSIPVRVEVVDAKLAPVPDAKVVAVHWELYPVVTVQTDAAGMATFRVPDTTDLTHIFAAKAGVGFDYVENFTTTPFPLADPPPKEARLILEPPRSVGIKAIGTDDTPVQGVESAPSYVKIAGKKGTLSLQYAARAGGLMRTTDAKGTVIHDWLPARCKQVMFIAEAPQYRQHETLYWYTQEGASAEMPSSFTTVMVRTQSLSGKVLLPNGRPAAGIMVKAHGTWNESRTRTRLDGTFTLRVASEKSYLVGVVDEKWAARSLQGIIVKEGQDREDLLIQLCQGTLLTGMVRDAATGKCRDRDVGAITELGANIDLTAFVRTSNMGYGQERLTRWFETDAKGRYSIRLGPGEYTIYLGRETLRLTVADEPELQRDLSIQVRN